MSNSIVNTACSSAWDYPVLDIGSRSLRNCCKTPHNKIPPEDLSLGVDLFKKFIPIRNIKLDLLEGKRNINCTSCWNAEEVGGQSARTGFENFAKFINATKWITLTLDETKDRLLNLSEADKKELVDWEYPTHLEIMLSTTCDLKCIYCNQNFSSQWYAERLKYKEIPIQEPKTNIEEYENIWWNWFETVAYKTINQLSFVGGEPLLDDKLYQYINRILDIRQLKNINDHLVISIVTNFNTPKKYLEKFLAMIQRISISPGIEISICISLESTGNRNEFIRTGSNWQLFQNNLHALLAFLNDKEIQKTNVYILPAFCSLSISDMLPFIKFVIGLTEQYSKLLIVSNTHVDYPRWSSPFILTNDYIKHIDRVTDYLTTLKVTNLSESQLADFDYWKKSFIAYLTTIKIGIANSNLDTVTTNKIRKEFIANIDKLSARRNLDFHTTFPEMVEFYNFCKTII